MGNPLSEYGVSDKVTVEHVLVISLSKSLEEPLRKVVRAWGESSRETLKSLQILGYAASAYLVMLGASHLIDSLRQSRRKKSIRDEDDEEK